MDNKKFVKIFSVIGVILLIICVICSIKSVSIAIEARPLLDNIKHIDHSTALYEVESAKLAAVRSDFIKSLALSMLTFLATLLDLATVYLKLDKE